MFMCFQAQRKRRPTESPRVSRPSIKTSRVAQSRRAVNRGTHTGADSAPPAETIDVMDNTDDGQCVSLRELFFPPRIHLEMGFRLILNLCSESTGLL